MQKFSYRSFNIQFSNERSRIKETDASKKHSNFIYVIKMSM